MGVIYKIKVWYVPNEADRRRVRSIPTTYDNKNGYVDSKSYRRGQYDTTVFGLGRIQPGNNLDFTGFPYPCPVSQFDLNDLLLNGDTLEDGIEFETSNYNVAFYYLTVGKQLRSQGFNVEVTKATSDAATGDWGNEHDGKHVYYTGPDEFTPKLVDQVVDTSDTHLKDDIVFKKVPVENEANASGGDTVTILEGEVMKASVKGTMKLSATTPKKPKKNTLVFK